MDVQDSMLEDQEGEALGVGVVHSFKPDDGEHASVIVDPPF